VVALVGSFLLFPFIGGAFMPESDESQYIVSFETPEGSSLQYTRQKAEQLANAIGAMSEVEYTYTTIGAGQTGTVTAGQVFVSLVPRDDRSRSQSEMMLATRDLVTPVYGVTTAVLSAGGF